jgi:Uma2 family endonuclease
MLMIMATETITRKLFTVDEYHRMWDIGIFPEDKRFELIRGEILEMPTAKPPHSGRVNRLNHLFTSRLGESVLVSIQNPSSIDDYSEPVPDVSLVKPRLDFYTSSHPLPEDVLLVIEISHTTLRFDTRIKAPLYAEAGILEYWILNIPQNVLEVFTEPVNGRYTKHEILKHGQTVSPLAFPEVTFRVDEILGERDLPK